MLWLCTLGLAQASPERILDYTEVVLSHGPRAHDQPGEHKTLAWVTERLRANSYEPLTVGDPGVLFACSGGEAQAGALWFLAHTDAVHASVPGAIDNAVAVAALVVLAEDLAAVPPPSQVCVGFPRAEELGLVGSRDWVSNHAPPQPGLVVALDLVGQGQLSATGLGPLWGDEALSWLAQHREVQAPVAYRVVSRQLGIERSDHAPFAEAGVLSMHLLGRGRSGIYWPYHSVQDDLSQVEVPALDALHRTLVRMAHARPLPSSKPSAALILPVLGVVLPGGLVWLLWVAGLGVTPVAWRGWKAALHGLAASAVGCLAGGLAWGIAGWGRPQAAALATPLTLCWLLGCCAVLSAWPKQERTGQGGALAFGVLALACGLFDPVMGIWLSLGSLALAIGKWRPLVGLLGAALPLYLCAPATWRELVFHHLLPDQGAWYLPVRALVCWPLAALALAVPRWRWAPLVLAGLCGILVGVTRLLPAFSTAFPSLGQ
jgi:hypothetical protein